MCFHLLQFLLDARGPKILSSVRSLAKRTPVFNVRPLSPSSPFPFFTWNSNFIERVCCTFNILLNGFKCLRMFVFFFVHLEDTVCCTQETLPVSSIQYMSLMHHGRKVFHHTTPRTIASSLSMHGCKLLHVVLLRLQAVCV
jgi:hypothetical protein